MCRALCRVQTPWQSQSTGFHALVNKSTSIWKLCILRTKVPLAPRALPGSHQFQDKNRLFRDLSHDAYVWAFASWKE